MPAVILNLFQDNSVFALASRVFRIEFGMTVRGHNGAVDEGFISVPTPAPDRANPGFRPQPD